MSRRKSTHRNSNLSRKPCWPGGKIGVGYQRKLSRKGRSRAERRAWGEWKNGKWEMEDVAHGDIILFMLYRGH
jgi:hypothetical protein